MVERFVAASMSLAACSFHTVPAPSATPGDGTHAADAAADVAHATIDARPDGPPPLCDTSDASLKLCLEFDEVGLAAATTARDGSGLGHDATIANIGVTTRTTPHVSQAVSSSTSTSITIPKSNDFNLQQFTLTAWVNYHTTPASQQGVLDTGKQYTMSVNNNDQVQCAISNNGNTLGLNKNVTLVHDTWQLVGCTYDGAMWCALAVRGTSVDIQCEPFNASVDTSPTFGTAIAAWATSPVSANFIGDVDEIRVYGRALSSSEICAAAGLSC